MNAQARMTQAQLVRAKAFELAVPTVAGRGARSFSELFERAEEIEVWLHKAGKERDSEQSVADRIERTVELIAPTLADETEQAAA